MGREGVFSCSSLECGFSIMPHLFLLFSLHVSFFLHLSLHLSLLFHFSLFVSSTSLYMPLETHLIPPLSLEQYKLMSAPLR